MPSTKRVLLAVVVAALTLTAIPVYKDWSLFGDSFSRRLTPSERERLFVRAKAGGYFSAMAGVRDALETVAGGDSSSPALANLYNWVELAKTFRDDDFTWLLVNLSIKSCNPVVKNRLQPLLQDWPPAPMPLHLQGQFILEREQYLFYCGRATYPKGAPGTPFNEERPLEFMQEWEGRGPRPYDAHLTPSRLSLAEQFLHWIRVKVIWLSKPKDSQVSAPPADRTTDHP